jgi:hypothetical protein
MKWEIKNNIPNRGDVRFKTRFAWLPTTVLSKITMTDHIVWLQLYLEEQEYIYKGIGWSGPSYGWQTVAKTIHI